MFILSGLGLYLACWIKIDAGQHLFTFKVLLVGLTLYPGNQEYQTSFYLFLFFPQVGKIKSWIPSYPCS